MFDKKFPSNARTKQRLFGLLNTFDPRRRDPVLPGRRGGWRRRECSLRRDRHHGLPEWSSVLPGSRLPVQPDPRRCRAGRGAEGARGRDGGESCRGGPVPPRHPPRQARVADPPAVAPAGRPAPRQDRRQTGIARVLTPDGGGSGKQSSGAGACLVDRVRSWPRRSRPGPPAVTRRSANPSGQRGRSAVLSRHTSDAHHPKPQSYPDTCDRPGTAKTTARGSVEQGRSPAPRTGLRSSDPGR